MLVRGLAVRPAVAASAGLERENPFVYMDVARQIAVKGMWKLVFVFRHLGLCMERRAHLNQISCNISLLTFLIHLYVCVCVLVMFLMRTDESRLVFAVS